MPETSTAQPPLPTEAVRLSWSEPKGMVGLSVVNFLLKIVTLGIYGFWGKTEVRRRIWSAIRLNGEPMHYSGTGKELFIGFLVVFGIVVLPLTLVSVAAALAFGPQSIALQVVQLVLYGFFFYLLGVGIHRAQRYRLSRTNWRGVRGGLDGSAWTYAGMHVWTILVVAVTLGWASPWRATKLQSAIVNDMRFGNRHMRFDAPSAPLYKRFAVLWFGGFTIMIAIVVLGFTVWRQVGIDPDDFRRPGSMQIIRLVIAIYGVMFIGLLLYGVLSAWYRAGLMNHFAAHTHFEGLTFKGRATAGSLIWLTVSNLLLVVLTLGLLSPVAQARSARYFVTRLAIDGEAPLADIAQGAADGSQRGEGLAQVFDVDAF